MDPRIGPDDAAGWFRRARVVWGAMLAAIALYGVVLLALPVHGAGHALPGLRTVLIGIAAGSGVAAWVLHRRVAHTVATAGRPPLDDAARAQRFGRTVVAWSLAESIAIHGFVLALLERTPAAAVPFFVASAALLLLTQPRPEWFR